MAIAFIRAKPISRAKGQSAVGCAAYRSCEKLNDQLYEKIHDYSKKSGHIAGGLLLPDGLNLTREELWNKVEESEKRVDGRLAKEFIVAMPKEFSDKENILLTKEIVKALSEERKPDGTVNYYPLQWDLHGPHIEALVNEDEEFVFDSKGNKVLENNGNVHAHIMVTERYWDFQTNGFASKKDRERNSKEWLAAKKLEIGEIINKRLRDKGLPEIDFRDFATRDKEAFEKTGEHLKGPQKHKGVSQINSERKGRRRRARRKQQIKGQLAVCKEKLKKLDSKSKLKGTENPVSNGSAKVRRMRPLPVEQKTKNIEYVPPVRSGSLIPASTKKSNPGFDGGPDVKCLICIPDGSDKCKKCRFNESKNDYENSR